MIFVCVVAVLVIFSVNVAAEDCDHRWSIAGECIECGLACEHDVDRDNYTVVAPTCIEQGYTVYTCMICGTDVIGDYTDATGHIYDQENTSLTYKVSNATCTSPAKYHYSCVCGEEGALIFTSGSALGHRWSAAGDCIECGLACEHDVDRDNYTVVAPTCTEQGYTVYTCMTCGTDVIGDYTDSTGHTYDQENTSLTYKVSNATCTSPAKYHYSCVCGEEGVLIFTSGSALGHRWSAAGDCIECGIACDHEDSLNDVISVVSPSCTTQGYTLYSCSICLAEVKSDYTPVSDHTYDQKNTDLSYRISKSTCTSPAKYYYSCVCGEEGGLMFTSGSALGHRWSTAGECIECGLACDHASSVSGICTDCGVVLVNVGPSGNYLVHLDLIVGAVELSLESTVLNAPIKYVVDIEKDRYDRLLFEGFCAIRGGVEAYYYDVVLSDGTVYTNIPIINNYTGFRLSEDQIDTVTNSGLIMQNYDINGRFQFYLNLEEYGDEAMTVFVYARSNNDKTARILEIDIVGNDVDFTNPTSSIVPILFIVSFVVAVVVLLCVVNKRSGKKPGEK